MTPSCARVRWSARFLSRCTGLFNPFRNFFFPSRRLGLPMLAPSQPVARPACRGANFAEAPREQETHTRVPRSISRQRPRTEALSFGIVKWFKVYNKRHRKQASPFSLLAAAYTQCFDGFATGLGSGRCQRLFGTQHRWEGKLLFQGNPKPQQHSSCLLVACC